MNNLIGKSQEILDKAITEWNPVAIVCAYSGGYDSLVLAYLVHTQLDTHNLPLTVWTVDTKLSADGWLDYVTEIGKRYNWSHTVHDNQRGFDDFVKSVTRAGCPYSKRGHTIAYRCLKDRSFSVALKTHKGNKKSNKVLFLSGVRASESADRENAPEYSRYGHTSTIIANLILHWTNEDVYKYRLDNDLPLNPFYDTVKGSGDCQCNWGNFIKLAQLQRYSPELASGNVALVDRISKELHGYGWDGEDPNQMKMFDEDDLDYGEFSTPFLCSNCSRSKKPTNKSSEFVALQRGLF